MQLGDERVVTAPCAVCGRNGQAQSVLGGLLRRCPRCTFVWTAVPVAPPEELYDDTYHAGGGYADYYDPDARRFESRLRLRWLLGSGRPRTLLEVGSAAGFFVAAARDAGIDARGVELSAPAVAYARGELQVPVEHTAFEDASFDATVDVVCAFHVLEHVTDPVAFLRTAWQAIAPGGRLALEVPNIASAAADRLGSAWPEIQPKYHRWHFTPPSLRRLLTDNDFDVIREDTVFSRFYWPRLARLRHARELVIADWAACGSTSVTHPTRGDILRVVARRRGPRWVG